MSVVADSMRAMVEERARFRCEYCHLPTRGQVATFPVDHIIPKTLGGESDLNNLALACPHCNAHKWAFTTGVDPDTNDEIPLFNPRQDQWEDHFFWSANSPDLLEAITPRGRATIRRLQMNADAMRETRQLMRHLALTLSMD